MKTLHQTHDIFKNILNKNDIINILSDEYNIIGDLNNFQDIIKGYGSFLVPEEAKQMKNKVGTYCIKNYYNNGYKVVIEEDMMVSIYNNFNNFNNLNSRNYSTEPIHKIKATTIFIADNGILLHLKDFMYICITNRITQFKALTKTINFVLLTIYPYAIDEFVKTNKDI